MKKLIKNLFNTFLIVSSLALVSCNNIMHNDEEQKSLTKITLTATVDLGDTSRKAVPEDYSLYKSLTYKLKATCNTDNSYSIEPFFETPEIELELIAANWSFELTAYDAGNTPIFRSSENVNIDITEDTVLNFKMVGVANGSLEYKFLIGEFTEEELGGEELNFTTLRNPVLVFEFYKYKGSIQETLLHKIEVTDTPDLVITEGTRETYEYIDEEVQMREIPITIVHRKDSFSLPEGTYFVICKKAERSEEEPVVNEETVKTDSTPLKFFFQELVEIKAGLTTTSGYNDISSTSPEYKITFHTNGGRFEDDLGKPNTSVMPIVQNECYSYQFNNATKIYQIIPEPSKENYVFQGWFYDSELTEPLGNPYGDGFPLLNEDVGFLGNVELYAKWVPIYGEKPNLLFYNIDKYQKPKFSNMWNPSLENVDSSIFDVVQKNNVAYYLQKNSDGTYFCSIDEGNNSIINKQYTSADGYEVERLAVDDATNKVYLILGKTKQENENYKQYFVVTYENEEFSNEISLGTELSETGVCYHAQIKSFNVNNGTIWLSFYNYDSTEGDEDPDQKKEATYNDYISLLYICTSGDEGYSITKKQVPALLTCLDGTLSELKHYSYITDLAFKDNKVYATVKTSPYDYFYDATPTNGKMLYFGGIVEIDPNTYHSKSLFAFDSANIKTFNLPYHDFGSDEDKTVNYQYMGVNSQRDTTTLAGPTKILAIKEDELIMVDEGAFAWVDKAKGYNTDVNRIVVFDLLNSSIKYVCPVNRDNIKFSYAYDNSASVPGFFSLFTSTSSLF